MKIADLNRDGAPRYASNRAIAKMTYEDYGLLRCENTIQAAKNELEKSRLLIIKRGAAKKTALGNIRRPAHMTQASGDLACKLGFRNQWCPGVIFCDTPKPNHLTPQQFRRLLKLRVTKTQFSSKTVKDKVQGSIPWVYRFVDRINRGLTTPKRMEEMAKPPKRDAVTKTSAELWAKWLPRLPLGKLLSSDQKQLVSENRSTNDAEKAKIGPQGPERTENGQGKTVICVDGPLPRQGGSPSIRRSDANPEGSEP